MNSIVAIVGRPNVGKSTLFNRLVQRRDAIVDSVSGVTRDRHYGKSDWNGKEFSVIGLLFTSFKIKDEPEYDKTILSCFSCIESTIGSIINRKISKHPPRIVIDVFNFII